MTSRPSAKRVGPAYPLLSTTLSPAQPTSSLLQVSSESLISASCIPLPPGFIIHFAVFSAQTHVDIDIARRKFHENYSSNAVEDSLLTYSQVTKDEATLWIFNIGKDLEGDTTSPFTRLQNLELHGLIQSSQDCFSYAEIYPCCDACSLQRSPCPICLESQLSSSDASAQRRMPMDSTSKELASSPSSLLDGSKLVDYGRPACHLPRYPLRQPLAFFLNAVQERVINDICEKAHSTGKVARRLRSGVLWGLPSSNSDWGDGWKQHGKIRPLSFSHIEVTLFPSGLLVQPQFRRTHFYPFLQSLPMHPGAPINLLPFSTPAYYLNMYSGYTSTLNKQFRDSLTGLGTGDFLPSQGDDNTSIDSEDSSQFVIAWVSVQNKQGEEKGMIVIWPALLCLSLMSTPESPGDQDGSKLFAYNRKPLAYIPELPLALQASPVPAPAKVPPQPRAVSPQDSLASSSLFTPVGHKSFSRESTSTPPLHMQSISRFMNGRPLLIRAPSYFSAEATQAFRSFTISQLPPNGMQDLAMGVGKFVDFMAKERERERQRIKSEKEASNFSITPIPKVASLPLRDVVPSTDLSGLSSLRSRTVYDLANLTPGSSHMTPSITVDTHSLGTQLESQQPPVLSIQPSYPSPPEETVKIEQTTPLSSGSYEDHSPEVVQGDAQKVEATASETFDTFNNMDKFMMDLGMDFTIPSSSGHQDTLSARAVKVDLDLFTDDDFSFFDEPTSTDALTTALPKTSVFSSEEALAPFGMPALLPDGLSSAIPNSTTSLFSFENCPPWISTAPMENINQQESERRPDHDHIFEGSLGSSSSSPVGPSTPKVICTFDADSTSSGMQPFNPIRFSKHFRSADAKYAIGKFKISSELSEKSSLEHEPPVMVLWRFYDSVTDPRVDAVKKLIGVKRRIDAQGVRIGPLLPPFQATRDEWESCPDDGSIMDIDSDPESDDESQNVGESGIDSISRPSTPIASHIPLGPTLISTQFAHSLLLPLAVNLRPPGASFADMASPLPNPVPTPVSPAAVLGLASEKSKALELITRTLCLEVIENGSWAEAWRANSTDQSPFWKPGKHLEDVDASFDGSYFLSLGWLWRKTSIKALSAFVSKLSVRMDGDVECEDSGESYIKELDQPMFTVGKGQSLVNLLPSALHFWSKLGLSPRSGPKDVVSFALYEESKQSITDLKDWLDCISSRYSAKGYGAHHLGSSLACSLDGVIPSKFTAFRKTINLLVDSIESIDSTVLIYIITPSSILSLSSPILRQILSSINRVQANPKYEHIYFHLVPDLHFNAKDDVASAPYLEKLVDSVYDRIPRPVDRLMSRSFFAHGEKRRKLFEAPSFTLARSAPAITTLSFHHPPLDLCSMDHNMLLHVAYRLTRCKKWIVAACIDQRGEGHDLGIWLASDEGDHKHTVSQVWSFAVDFAKRANIEWRIAIAKLGTVDEAELDAWNMLLSDKSASDGQIPGIQVSILCVDDESGWSVLPKEMKPSRRPPSGHDSHGKGQIVSSSRSTYILPLSHWSLSSNYDLELGVQQHVPDDDDTAAMHGADRLRPLRTVAMISVLPDGAASPKAQFIHLLQAITFPSSILTKTLEETHQDICRNYHELAVLTEARWSLYGESALPYHLAALHVVDSTLELREVTMD